MGKTLNFKIQRQQLSQWCWAAVAASVCDFYNDTGYGSQCAFVTSVTGLGDCCQSCQDDGESSVCNQPFNLGSALWECHHGVKVKPDVPDLGLVSAQLEAGHPVACNVYWSDGNAHALVIFGYTDDGVLLIADPEKPGTVVSIHKGFVYSTTYDEGDETGKITEVFQTR